MATPDPLARPADGGSVEPLGTEAAGSHFRLPLTSASTSKDSLIGLLGAPDQGPAILPTSNTTQIVAGLTPGNANQLHPTSGTSTSGINVAMDTMPDQLVSSVGICEQYAHLLNASASLDAATHRYKEGIFTGDFVAKEVVQLLMYGRIPESLLEPYLIGTRDMEGELREMLRFYSAKSYLFPTRGDGLEVDEAIELCEGPLKTASDLIQHIRMDRAKASYGSGRGSANAVDLATAFSQATPALADKLGDRLAGLLTPLFAAISSSAKAGDFHTIAGSGVTGAATVVRTPQRLLPAMSRNPWVALMI